LQSTSRKNITSKSLGYAKKSDVNDKEFNENKYNLDVNFIDSTEFTQYGKLTEDKLSE